MARKYLDYDGLLYFWQKIKAIFATQTDLDDLEDRVDDLVTTGGEPNVIETVQVNGTDLTPDANKAVNVTVTTGTSNGTIAVNGSNVSVYGLGSAAYTASTDYDASGAAAAVLGSASDTSSANTVYGAKAAAAEATSAISTEIAKLDSSASAASNCALSAITITDGKISASSDITVPTNNSQLTNGAGYQTASDVQTLVENYGYTTNTGTVTSITLSATSPISISSSAAITTSGSRTISHASSGVTAGTYKSVTVNATGHVTAGTNPTTLSGFGITDAYTKTETDSAISTAIGGITGISFEVVASLPVTGSAGTIYLVANSGSSPNIYDEYIYVNSAFEKIGTTDVDLSNYLQTTDIVSITNAEIDTILAA